MNSIQLSNHKNFINVHNEERRLQRNKHCVLSRNSELSNEQLPGNPELRIRSTLAGRAFPVRQSSQRNRLVAWTIGALALSLLAYMIFSGPHSQNNNLTATDISNPGEIDTMTHLGGLPVVLLQNPGCDVFISILGKEFPNSWHNRLLEGNDLLKDVLKRDWKVVAALGITHIKIANILEKLLTRANSKITYDPSELKNDLLGCNFNTQVLNIEEGLKLGCSQSDPFYMINKNWKYPLDPYMCHSLKIENPSTGQKIEFSPGMIDLIRKFGFYAGGTYRVDPVQLIAILTGQDSTALQKSLSLKQDS
jgi:hypothetical protein